MVFNLKKATPDTSLNASAFMFGADSQSSSSPSIYQMSVVQTLMWTNPILVNPDICVAHGTSLALGGATLGGNALAVSGTTNLIGSLTLGTQQTIQGSAIFSNTAAGAYPTTVKSSNSSTEAWTFTLPPNKGTNGYVLTTNGSGTSAWTNPTALGIDIDVNSTAITGGSTGRIVYDNAGTFGEISAVTTNGSDTLTIGVQQTTQGNIVLGNTAAGAFSTTVQSSNSASAAWSLTLPTTAGSSGYFLVTDGSGVSSWSNNIGAAVGTSLNLSSSKFIADNAGNLSVTRGFLAAGSDGAFTGTFTDGLVLDYVSPTARFSAGTTDGFGWYNGGIGNTTLMTLSSGSALTLGVQQTTQGSLVLANTSAGAFATTIKASNSASAAWTFTLPVTSGSSGYVLTTDGSGNSSWTNPTSLPVNITINSTSITSGTSGRILYDNAGTVGELTTTGTGSVVLATTPTFATSALFPDGSVSAPSISHSGDTNCGIYFPSADNIGFVTNGVERYRVDNNGNYLFSSTNITVTSSSTPAFQINSTTFNYANMVMGNWAATTAAAAIYFAKSRSGTLGDMSVATASGDALGAIQFEGSDTVAIKRAAGIVGYADALFSAGSSPGRLVFSTTASGSTSTTERMRIDSSGNVGIGKTAASGVRLDVSGSIAGSTTIRSSGATSGIGYATGAGGAVTQGTNRTTGVTLNNVSGAITLVSAAGSASYQTFTVTNSAVAATDTIIVNQKSGTDKYIILVTAVTGGTFDITFATTGGTTTEQPVFNFAVIKAVAA